MHLLRNKWFWIALFSLLFIASIDIWAWGWTGPSILGLPYIILYTIFLEGLLLLSFLIFSRYFWSGEGK